MYFRCHICLKVGHCVSRLYRAVGAGVGAFWGLLQRSQGDQLLVVVQALNVNCALSFKRRESQWKMTKGVLIKCDNGAL